MSYRDRPADFERLGGGGGWPQPYSPLGCNRKIAGRGASTAAVSILLPMQVISLFFIFLMVSLFSPRLIAAWANHSSGQKFAP